MATKAASIPLLSVVVPMYNEEAGIEPFFKEIVPALDDITTNWEIVCVNDGSKDKTLELLEKHHKKENRIKVIDLSRNFGKEAALTAGLEEATGEAVVPIDADLQDPPSLISEMVKKWREGYQVVLATRKKRSGDSLLKRATAKFFYKLIGMSSNVDIPANTGDFRLMDRQVVEAVKTLPEKTRFMKGLFAWVGFSTTTIYYDRPKRHSGSSAWSYRKLWRLALDGIFSFTTFPLHIWTYVGVVISSIAFVYVAFLVIRTLVFGVDVPGYASIMASVLFMGGIQLISLGIIGEYITRIYRETKQRPLYIVREKLGL